MRMVFPPGKEARLDSGGRMLTIIAVFHKLQRKQDDGDAVIHFSSLIKTFWCSV
jgi:uncharacterized membrane protein